MLSRLNKTFVRKTPLLGFISAYASFTLLAFQHPLLAYALPFIDLGSTQGLVQLASLQVIQVALMAMTLLALSLLPTPVIKAFCIVILFANAGAAYFMMTYNAEIDRTMIGNILNTDKREMLQIWHPKLLLQILLFAVLPSLLIWRMQIVKPRWFIRLGVFFLVLVALIAWAYATAFTWLWFDKHAPRLGGRVLPWSYIANTARYFNQAALAGRVMTESGVWAV